MKKKILFLILLLLPFIVSAEKFNIEFESPKMYTEHTFNSFYKDGYIFIDTEYMGNSLGTDSLIQYYDAEWNLVKSKEYNDFSPELITTSDDFIYILVYKQHKGYTIYKLNEELEAVNILDAESLDWNVTTGALIIENNKVYTYIRDEESNSLKILELDENLKNPVIKEISTSDFFNKYSLLNLPDRVDVVEIVPIDNGYLLSLTDYRDCTEENWKPVPSIRKIDKDFNTVWEKIFDNYRRIDNVVSTPDKTFFIAYSTTKDSERKGDLLVVNNKGELEETIIKDNAVGGLAANKEHILISSGEHHACLQGNYTDEDGCKSAIRHTIYSIEYDIVSKITGKGQVVVSTSSFSHKGVTFEVIPEKGYVLSEVKVTDEFGNVIKFTDYKFTMPSANVLIEAVFVPDNPNTGSFISYIAIVLGGITFITTYLLIQKSKLNKIKW